MNKNYNEWDKVLEESSTIKRKCLSDKKFEICFKGQKVETVTTQKKTLIH